MAVIHLPEIAWGRKGAVLGTVQNSAWKITPMYAGPCTLQYTEHYLVQYRTLYNTVPGTFEHSTQYLVTARTETSP